MCEEHNLFDWYALLSILIFFLLSLSTLCPVKMHNIAMAGILRDDTIPVDTGRKLNVHKTFRRRPGRLLNVLCTFNLRPVSTGMGERLKI